MTVADTDVLIDFLEGQGAAQEVAAELSAGRLWTTVISYFELMSGAHDRNKREKIRTLLDALEILPLNREAADRAAGLRRELERTGLGIGMADSLIAGIVVVQGAALMTRNRQHFKRVLSSRGSSTSFVRSANRLRPQRLLRTGKEYSSCPS